jgi:hypothetical protein
VNGLCIVRFWVLLFAFDEVFGFVFIAASCGYSDKGQVIREDMLIWILVKLGNSRKERVLCMLDRRGELQESNFHLLACSDRVIFLVGIPIRFLVLMQMLSFRTNDDRHTGCNQFM